MFQDIVKNLRDNWNYLKNVNENILKKPSVTSIEVKKGDFLNAYLYKDLMILNKFNLYQNNKLYN